MALSTRELYLVLRARDEASRIIRGFGNNLSRTGTMLMGFGTAAITAGAGMSALGVAGLRFLHSTIEVAAEYDRQARRTLTQVDQVGVSLEDVAGIGRRVAGEIGVPFETLQDTLFFIFSSMDVGIQDAETLLRSFSQAAIAGQTDVESVARSTIATMNALSIPVEDLSDVLDVQFQIVRKGIIDYEELSSVIGRALPATARAGQSFETLGGMIAFMTRNGLSAAMSATSAARALESFAHPTVVGRLEDIGIQVRGINGEFRPLVDVMSEMNDHMADMSQPERVAFLQELFTGAGGTIQARRFWDLAFSNFEEFEDMIGHMEGATGAFDNAYGTMSESVAVQSELLRNKWMLLQEALGRALLPAFMQLVDILSQALDWFNALPEGTKAFIAQALAISFIVMTVVGVFLIFIGTLAFFIASIMVAGEALLVVTGVVAGVIAALIALGAGFYAAWQNSQDFRDVIGDIGEAFVDIWEGIKDVAGQLADIFQNTILPPVQAFGEVLENKVLPIVQDFIGFIRDELIPIIMTLAGIWMGTLNVAFGLIGWVIENTLIPAFNRLSTFYNDHKEEIDILVTWLSKLLYILVLLVVPLIIAAVAIGVMIAAVSALIFIITAVVDAISAFVEFLREKTGEVSEVMSWDNIGMAWSLFWQGLLRDASAVWMSIMQGIADFVSYITGRLGLAGQRISEIWRSAMNALANIARGGWATVQGIFRGAIQAIIGFFSAGRLYQAGRQLIQSLINGILDSIPGVRSAMSTVANVVGAFVPGSPVKEGPLKVLNNGYAGRQIVRMLLGGVQAERQTVQRTMSQLFGDDMSAGPLAFSTGQNSNGPVGLVAGQGGALTPVNQTFNISTQEINPTRHAAELGYLVAVRRG